MAGTTSVPAIAFTPTGPMLPTESAILAGVQADQNAAFGGNLNSGLSTPQGQLAQSQAAIVADKNAQIAFLCNQFDPQTASGKWQDGLGRIYFMSRLPAVPTAVAVTVMGLTGTVIPVGAQAIATDGSIYNCVTAVTIPVGGSITANFAAQVAGPTACPANTLNKIYRTIPGWDSVNNPLAGVTGSAVESPSQFEYRRQQTVAVNAQNSVQAIKAAVFDVPNVLDAYVIDNPAATTLTIGSVTLLAHSLWVCAAGGTSTDIAAAIWSKKAPGCDYNGSTSVTVFDTSYAVPQPQYTVKYQIATPTAIKFAISITNNIYLPANIVANIKAAIISAFNGGDGGPVARIGSSIFASRFYTPVLALATPGTAISILSLKLGISTATLDSVTMGIDQKPTISASDITVTLV
jgi:uncharacterized phage protein gp47/JayE